MGFFVYSLAHIVGELFVDLYITVMRKWLIKNESTLNKLGAIFFILSFLDLFILEGKNNILPFIIVIWLFYSIYKQGELFND